MKKTKKKEIECKLKYLNVINCPNMKEISSNYDMHGETYKCKTCGLRFRLYYDEMS